MLDVQTQHKELIVITLGMAFYWLQMRWTHNILVFSDVQMLGIGADTAILLTAVFIAAIGIGFLLTNSRIRQLLSSRRTVVLTCCITTVLNSVVLFSEPSFLGEALVSARIFFVSLSCFLLTVTWGLIISKRFCKSQYIALSLSFILCFLLFNIEEVPGFIGMLPPVMAPVLSALCQAFLSVEKYSDTGFSKKVTLPDKLFVTVIASFLFATGFMRWVLYNVVLSYVPHEDSLFLINSISVLTSLVILFIFLGAKKFDWAIYLTWTLFTLLCFTGLVMMAFFDNSLLNLGGSIVLMTRVCFGFLLFVLFSSYTKKYNSEVSFKFFIVYSLVDSLTTIVAYSIAPGVFSILNIAVSEHVAAISLLTILVVIGLSFLFFTRNTFLQLSEKQGSAGSELVVSPAEKAIAYAETTMISLKEREVLGYLYQGFTYRRIAELMYISPNTVVTHVKSIYRKLDVHSKQELIDRINSDG